MSDNSENLKILIEMGFNEQKSKKALSIHSNVQNAMEWLMAHANDPDLVEEQAKTSTENQNQIIENKETSSEASVCDNNENLKYLMEMGFNEQKSKKALSLKSDLQDAMEWLIEHANDPDRVEEQQASTSSVSLAENQNTEKKEESVGEAHSLKCDECGKLLKDADAATAHAYKTNHSSFSESVESIKPKTKEEIEEQKKRLQERLVIMRAEKAEKEKQDLIEREKMRRKQGREIHEIRQKHEEEEMKRIAEERRREKREAELAKQRVKEQIAKDREQQKLRAQGIEQPIQQPVLVQQEKRSYDECKIQVRLTDGKTMQQTFKAKEQLAAVRLWIELNRTDDNQPFSIVQPFPRKQYNDDDMMRTLEDLGLVPASSLIITRKV